MSDEAEPLIFVSHVHEDRKVAAWLRERLEKDFLGLLRVFVSSDGEGIGAGDEWFAVVRKRIEECRMLVILCTPDSVAQPWVNFEFGAAWALKKPYVPICHGGLTPDRLAMPFSNSQAVTLETPEGLEALYRAVAKLRGIGTPSVSFAELASSLSGADSTDGDVSVIWQLLRRALSGEYEWRRVETVANEAGTSVEQARAILRAHASEVRFGTGKSGEAIVGLRSRVGSGRA